MNDLINKFINKNCIIVTFEQSRHHGIILEQKENWVSIKNKYDNIELINIDFITNIKECKTKVKNKKKDTENE